MPCASAPSQRHPGFSPKLLHDAKMPLFWFFLYGAGRRRPGAIPRSAFRQSNCQSRSSQAPSIAPLLLRHSLRFGSTPPPREKHDRSAIQNSSRLDEPPLQCLPRRSLIDLFSHTPHFSFRWTRRPARFERAAPRQRARLGTQAFWPEGCREPRRPSGRDLAIGRRALQWADTGPFAGRRTKVRFQLSIPGTEPGASADF